ncbi:metalloreductase [Coprinellus micaceus]|uniref:Metalloreductase n=1 Tax=Coprinellus micaceus TaxID=71717 RepID=A0A4Y7TAD1_COPMI|nr:metalloreductase [Coprinellus micaceus]
MAAFGRLLYEGSVCLPALVLLILSHLAAPVTGDGRGLIGLGKWIYRPFCAHACRAVIEGSKVSCSSSVSSSRNGTSSSTTRFNNKRHPHDTSKVNECFLKDAAFLRTLSLCIAEHCPRDGVRISVIEGFWEGHVAAGVLENTALRPVVSYQDVLRNARRDVERVGQTAMPYVEVGEPFNTTSMVRDEDWLPLYNARKYLERNEGYHQRNALSIAASSIILPVLLSFLRFLPGRPRRYSQFVASLERPLVGYRHRTPIISDLGIMPTRGQTLYIVYILAAHGVLCVFPLFYLYPNSIAPNRAQHYLIMIGDRTGVVAMANLLPLLLFSSRNNVLLWITNWRHSTFLLLHRWIGYCLIIEISAHSLLMFLLHLLHLNDLQVKSKQPPWILGMAATFAFALIYPFSLLPIRKRVYELFLVCHQVLAAVAILATFMHINYLFQYHWGYDIWIYVGGGVWFLDRALRIARIVSNGWRIAVLSAIDEETQFVRVEIDGIAAEGHLYLYLPTLSWKFWENHPYSVLSSFAGGASPDARLGPGNDMREKITTIRPKTTLLIRSMDGFYEGPHYNYHANPAIRNLSHCSSLLCIAGGVGITAVLPLIKTFGGVRSRLEWGVRSEPLVRAVQPEIAALTNGPKVVEVNTSLGRRVKVAEVVREELQREDDSGDLGVVVCGPLSMADDVRMVIAELGPKVKRGVVFIDESFSW